MIKILCEKTYFESNWCRQIMQGLLDELKRKRIDYSVVFEFSDIKSDETLYIVGSNYLWISKAVGDANAVGCTPIVIFNQIDHSVEGKYHSVSSDIRESVSSLVRWLEIKGNKNVCMYGVNPSSGSDVSRSEIYVNTSKKPKVFYNHGSLEECFKEFAKVQEHFDAVICTNDFAAISLAKHLKEHGTYDAENIELFSCSHSSLSPYFAGNIRTVTVNFSSLGKNAYEVWRIAERGENVSEISLTVKCSMDFAEEYALPYVCESSVEDTFYDDPELIDLLKIDHLLESADELDKKIIGSILSDKTYLEIAEDCHLSEQSVKYRVKQYLDICALKKRKELCELLNRNYIKIS